jgi:hypothetical protein
MATSLIPSTATAPATPSSTNANETIYFGVHGKSIMIGLAATVGVLLLLLLLMGCCWPKEKKRNDGGGYVTTTYGVVLRERRASIDGTAWGR